MERRCWGWSGNRAEPNGGRARTAPNGRIWQVMADFHGKLTRKREEAIVALLSTRSVEDAARSCKTPVRTLFRWLKERDFDAAYRAAKWAAFGQAIARLHHLSSAAVSTLGKVMLDAATPPATKVRAADSILNHTIKAMETEEIEARLAELERATQSPNPDRRFTSGRRG